MIDKRTEKKDLEVNHENVIVALNDCMAEKSKAQIHLNETRDILRDTNQAVGFFFILNYLPIF